LARRRGAEFGPPADNVYWLISDEPSGVFVTDLADLGLSLPVFGFREEAELFLALDGLGSRWQAVEGGAGDFLALLFGPHADVKSVILGPLPAMLRDGTAGLASLSLGSFMGRFLDVPSPTAHRVNPLTTSRACECDNPHRNADQREVSWRRSSGSSRH
jgi:hypothetical protein